MSTELLAEIAVTNIVKALLALTTLAFLLLFYLQWFLLKSRLSALELYARSRFMKNSLGLGLGMAALSLAFMLDAGLSLGRLQGNVLELGRSLLEVLALVLFGWWYYALSREKMG
ncbi:MAG: hypothetical protein QXG98_06205 [Candidatus Micrarchaeia archaeon]